MICPVILTGGSGTRLWPVSRKSYPKQFRNFAGDVSLFQQTVQRMQGAGFAAPMVLTGEDFRFIVQDHLKAIKAPCGAILVEPEGRNTAPAILAAALKVEEDTPGTLMLVLPSDHAIPDAQGFRAMIEAAAPAADAGRIVTFGVTPDRPETGFGYLELDGTPGDVPVPLKGFVEKPDADTAATLIKTGRHLWNAGIFLFRSDTMIKAFKKHAPDLIDPVTAAVNGAQTDLGFDRLDAAPWAQAADISIDYAVMEKADNLSAMAFSGAWSDLGSWEALWEGGGQNEAGVSVRGGAQDIECENSLLWRDEGGPTVVGLGVKDTIVVATKDAVLVADKSRAQDVKQAVNHLEAAGDAAGTQTVQYHRPWGWYETLALGTRFQVKRIVVKPGGILSLQSHHHRSEHWIVVEGTAKVTVDDEARLITENQSVYIPLGAVHRMENPGKLPMVLIEVQTGSYLGEDDIVRYEDLYKRPERE